MSFIWFTNNRKSNRKKTAEICKLSFLYVPHTYYCPLLEVEIVYSWFSCNRRSNRKNLLTDGKQRKMTSGSEQGCNLRVQLPALHMEVLGLVWKLWVLFLWKAPLWGFPAGPVIKALSIHCREHRFDPKCQVAKKKRVPSWLCQGQQYLREISLEAVSGSSIKVKNTDKILDQNCHSHIQQSWLSIISNSCLVVPNSL